MCCVICDIDWDPKLDMKDGNLLRVNLTIGLIGIYPASDHGGHGSRNRECENKEQEAIVQAEMQGQLFKSLGREDLVQNCAKVKVRDIAPTPSIRRQRTDFWTRIFGRRISIQLGSTGSGLEKGRGVYGLHVPFHSCLYTNSRPNQPTFVQVAVQNTIRLPLVRCFLAFEDLERMKKLAASLEDETAIEPRSLSVTISVLASFLC